MSTVGDVTNDSSASGPLDHLRVDLVGSFLRPSRLKETFTRYLAGAASEDELERAGDEAIRALIAAEEAHRLPVATDGEFRRLNFEHSFKDSVAGVEGWVQSYKQRTLGDQATPQHQGADPTLVNRQPVSQRLDLVRNRPLEEYRFAAGLAKMPVKVTLLGPDRVVQTFDWEQSKSIYPTIEEFVGDVVSIERQMVAQLIEAGCRYVHIDAPGYTAYIDERSLAGMRSRGEDPMANMERSIQADNALIGQFPGVTFGIHLCRGNRQSMWHREGSYDAIAEKLFGSLAHRRLLLEYDTERAGTFEPLRFVPKGKVVVLGLITTKSPELETVDQLRRRIDEASRYLPLEQLALSPQCGFASSLPGNKLGEDDQWRKLDVMLETARQVWG